MPCCRKTGLGLFNGEDGEVNGVQDVTGQQEVLPPGHQDLACSKEACPSQSQDSRKPWPPPDQSNGDEAKKNLPGHSDVMAARFEPPPRESNVPGRLK